MLFLRTATHILSFSPSALNGKCHLFFQSTLTFILGIVAFFALSPTLHSQDHIFNVHLLTTEDGLANLYTSTVYKDKRGYIWAGTAYGLNRFDGYNFKLFTREENALSTNTNITRIIEDDAGRLWLFYRGWSQFIAQPHEIYTIDIFDPKTKQAVPFDTLFSGIAPFKANEVYLPKINDPENRLWIHTNKGELYLFSNGQFEKVFQQDNAFFRCIAVSKKGDIWLGWENNLTAIDPTGKILEQVELPSQVVGAWAGQDQGIWVATRAKKGEPIHLWHKPKNKPVVPFRLMQNGESAEVQKVHPFLYRNQNGYWFAGIENQFHLFDQHGNWLCNYSKLLEKNLDSNFSGYFEDENTLWLASSSGVLNASVRTNPFQLIHRKDNMLSDCRSITEDENGNIYFLNKNAYQWNKHTQECREIPNSFGSAYSLLYNDSTLWVGTYVESTTGFEVDLRTGERTDYIPLGIGKFLVNTLAKTDVPDRYLAGFPEGLEYLDLRKQALLPYESNGSNSGKDSLLVQSEVNFIHKNTSGYWLATNNGIFLLKDGQGVVRHFDKSSNYLPFNYIRHIHEDEEGVFWLATKGGGIIRWHLSWSGNGEPPKNSRSNTLKSSYKQFTKEDGLIDNFTYAVYEDDYNKLWIPTDKGLMQMDKASYQVRTFTTEDGLPHNEFNFTAHYQSKDGTLYLGGLGGLITFHPKVFAEEGPNLTPLAFTGYYVLEEGTDKMADKTQILQENTDITILPSDKFFELHFTLLDYQTVGQHRYAYKIEGYSNNWNYIDEHFIRITNLPYGKYTLRIRGQHKRRGWSERELALAIHVAKPFYLQWWFIATLVLLVAGAILAAVRWRIIELERRKELLEVKVQERTLTIQQQAEELKILDKAKTRFFANITHEFRTPLTLIIGPLEQVISDPALPSIFRSRTGGILKNARHLLTLINQILDLSKIESGYMKTEATRGDIVTYTKEIISRFQTLAQKKDQQLRFLTPLNQWETNFDKEKWDKILYNLLSNAIKFTAEGQAIQASLVKARKDAQNYIQFEVKDSGIGIKKGQLSQIFDRFYQADNSSTRSQGGTGIGLSLVKELVEIQGGEIQVSSEVGIGTTFVVYLPVLEGGQLQHWDAEPFLAPIGLPTIEEEISLPNALVSDFREQAKLELLIIEDNDEMREYIRHCINLSRYNVREAADGEEGIEKAQALIPDLIITDVMMPKKNGFEVVKAIRSNISTSHIPLILLTARASLESRLKGLQRGADAYLTKPFSPQELVLRIDKLIEIRRLLQQRYKNPLPTEGDNTYTQEDEFIIGLRTYIREHLDEPKLDGDHIGLHFGMSRSSLYRKLKALTDLSISELVRDTRLNRALELLQEGKLNISEVAYQTGFTSISVFSRTFKKAYGKAPSEIMPSD